MCLVDLVIPTFDARDLALRCLAALTDPAIARVIVVDDASNDGTVAAVREAFPGADVLTLAEHHGLATALNRGARAGTAEFILFLNNDVFAAPGAVSELRDALLADPGAASAGGRLVDQATHRTQDSYRPRAIPGLLGVTARLVGIERRWPRNPWTGQHLRRPTGDGATVRVDAQPAGACLMVRRGAFEALGGWDERYWIWYEDVDLSRRLAVVGAALYVPRAMFEHVGGASTGGWSRPEFHRRLYHGTLQYAALHFSRIERALAGAVFVGVSLPRIVALCLLRRTGAGVYVAVLKGGLALIAGREPPSLVEVRLSDDARGGCVAPRPADP